jgi:hypothetical protein
MSINTSYLLSLLQDNTSSDNSFGRGTYPLPDSLKDLGRFVHNLRPDKLIAHKVFPEENTHMLVAQVNHQLSIMRRDMESLLAQGLVRIQSNAPGELSFYFEVKKSKT